MKEALEGQAGDCVCFVLFCFFGHTACGILVPPAAEPRSANHWTTREVPGGCVYHAGILGPFWSPKQRNHVMKTEFSGDVVTSVPPPTHDYR